MKCQDVSAGKVQIDADFHKDHHGGEEGLRGWHGRCFRDQDVQVLVYDQDIRVLV
jgi:hypothetical protein